MKLPQDFHGHASGYAPKHPRAPGRRQALKNRRIDDGARTMHAVNGCSAAFSELLMFKSPRSRFSVAATSFGFALSVLAAGCGTTTSAAGDTGVESDTTSTDDTAGTADNGADVQGGSDITSGTDAVSGDSSPSDSSADSFVLTDAQTGGNDGDLLDVELGDAVTATTGDVVNDITADDLKVFDLGQPDVSIDPKCTNLCQIVAAAKCVNDATLDKCVAGCSQGLAMMPSCAPLMYAMIDCAVGKTITCDSSGKSSPPAACATEMQASQDCFKNTTGGCNSTCAADSSGNCGCNGCVGSDAYGMDCQGGTCTCTFNGTSTGKTFPAATVCQNPGPAMDSNCKPAP
jgi:hypothetical protein